MIDVNAGGFPTDPTPRERKVRLVLNSSIEKVFDRLDYCQTLYHHNLVSDGIHRNCLWKMCVFFFFEKLTCTCSEYIDSQQALLSSLSISEILLFRVVPTRSGEWTVESFGFFPPPGDATSSPKNLDLCNLQGSQTYSHVYSRWWFQIFLFFDPYLGKIPILTNIFQMGWNHQLD